MSVEPTFAHLEAGTRVLGREFGFDDPRNPEGILGFGYGWLVRDGVWQSQLGLVLLAAAGYPGFPYKRVAVDADGGPVDVDCCTFVLDPETPHAIPPITADDDPELRPGAPLSTAAGYASGTFACAVEGTSSTHLLTAAHVLDFDLSERPVYCGQRAVGQVLSSPSDDALDLAWVRVDDGARPVGTTTPDGTAVAGVGRLSWEDLRHRGRVFCPRARTSKTPWILGAGMTLHLMRRDDRVFTQRNMIMTEACTQPGDSGTALLDQSGWVMGVLSHGRPEFSFFTSVASLRSSPFWLEDT